MQLSGQEKVSLDRFQKLDCFRPLEFFLRPDDDNSIEIVVCNTACPTETFPGGEESSLLNVKQDPEVDGKVVDGTE